MEMMGALQRNASAAPEAIALVTTGRELSWSGLERLAQGVRFQLSRAAGARIAIWGDELAASIALLAACQHAGSSVLLIPSYYTRERAREVAGAHAFDFLASHRAGTLELEALSAAGRSAGYEPFVGILTSGTTGTPKCARHTWASLAAAVRLDEAYRGRVWFLGYQIFHFAGMQVFLQAFLNGGMLAIPSTFDPGEGRELFLRHRAAYLNCTPTYLRQLLMTDAGGFRPEGVRKITLGGEVCDQALLDLAKARFPGSRISHVYASSELGAVLEVHDGREGFDAALIDGVRLRIVDGELQARRSARSMAGYLGLAGGGDEWFSTRDLVEVRDGRVRFLGRRDDVINVGGYKVNPLTVEEVIRREPAVLEVAVSGKKNALTGNLIVARVTLQAGADPQDARSRIVAACRSALPDYMVPRLFQFVEAIPMSPSQKLVRAAA
jgi:acyl-CoA synthetase (AMP-forming)/AMP-acid ligase II